MRAERAIILAAGFGNRLRPLTLETPKPLLTVHGRRFIETSLDALLGAGISEIYVVRGYLASRFDALLEKYPMIRFIDNPDYASANTISSVYYAREHLQNAYLVEGDLFLSDPQVIEAEPARSNYLGVPNDGPSEEWLMWADGEGTIRRLLVGGCGGHRLYGVSFWSAPDGRRLAEDVETLYEAGVRDIYFDDVVFHRYPEHYRLGLRACPPDRILEVDTLQELEAANA